MAEYCAFRVREFRDESPEAANSIQALAEMAAVNAAEAFGIEVDLSRELKLERPVIADARMMPHEWLLANGSEIYKCDGLSHGDDHFYPGPCDIAWDLAGAILEWQMEASGQEFLLANYQRLSGDAIVARLPPYVLAYSLFRIGFCSMAADATKGTAEELRLRAAENHYRQLALRQLNLEVAQCA